MDEIENNGIIEKFVSEWASLMVTVKKKDGGVSLCVDYRGLNVVTKFDAYSLPRMEELSVYLDDIAINSTNLDIHLEHLEKIFQYLKEANLTIKTAKCVFGKEDCMYMGYKIGKRVRPEDSKVQATAQMEISKTKKDVRAYLE
uniref:Reverse transcriptase domain-containing protein n=1 Tax=Amphimedon queenslandica TaxID=400682 RepID=A0A1X7UCT2_AMPQE